MKRYHGHLNASLKIRSQLEKVTPDSDRYQVIQRRLWDAESVCQELDEKIYWRVRELYFDSEYINHLKTTNQ